MENNKQLNDNELKIVAAGGPHDGAGSGASSPPAQPGGGAPIPPHGEVVAFASSVIGCPYAWGASGPGSFDAVGLVQWCYANVGISLPRDSEAMYALAKQRMSPTAANAGDVLYRSGHVAISTGGIACIEAPGTGKSVCRGSSHAWECALRF